MRHEQISAKETYDKVAVTAVWPVSAQVAPLPIVDIDHLPSEAFKSAPAAPDVPASVGTMIVGSYAALIGAFAAATARSVESIFMITISALFVVAFFTVPRLILAQEPHAANRPSFDRFMNCGMETFTGHCTGRAALVQMLIVPVLLTAAILVMGIAAAIIM